MTRRWLVWFVVFVVSLGAWNVGEPVPVSAAETTDVSTEIAVPESSAMQTFDGAEVTGTDDGSESDPAIATTHHRTACPISDQVRRYAFDYNCVPRLCEYGRTNSGSCEPDSPSFRYHTLICSSYSTDADARAYLNILPSKDDRAICPPRGMFLASPGTDAWPSWGFQKNVADDYGKVVVERSGECSGPKDDWNIDFPDKGTEAVAIALGLLFPGGLLGITLGFISAQTNVTVWDFQVPCKAHDHCFDLIRAGLSGTVTDDDCHNRMNDLMRADCNSRKLGVGIACRGVGSLVYNTVRVLSKVDPDPGLVRLENISTGMCADVDRSTLPNGQLSDGFADGTAVLQWTCRTFNADNQQFRLRPASFPGYFEIVPEHAIHLDKCVTIIGRSFVLDSCESKSEGKGGRKFSSPFQSFQIVSVANKDRYTIRSKAFSRTCWTIPLSDTSVLPRRGTVLANSICIPTNSSRQLIPDMEDKKCLEPILADIS